MSTLNSKTFNQVHWNWPGAVVVDPRVVPICVFGEWTTYAVAGEWPTVTIHGEWPTIGITGVWATYGIVGEWAEYNLSVNLEC